MKSDIEIARSIELVEINTLAKSYDIPEEHVTPYGRHMAKVDLSVIDEEKVKNGNLNALFCESFCKVTTKNSAATSYYCYSAF